MAWLRNVWIVLGTLGMHIQAQQTPKVVSQCYRSQGFSFVSLYCGWNRLIHIEAAIHGRHRNPRIQHCGELREDCTMEMLSAYDWSKCEGKHSCVQMIKGGRADMDVPGRCTGGVHYLQVEYQCVPLPGSLEAEEDANKNSSSEKRGKKIRKGNRKKSENRIDKTVERDEHDICVNRTLSQSRGSSLMIHSPGFPEYYMADTDCRCAVQAAKGAQVAVTYHNLALVMRARKCVDWLLLQSPGHKQSTAVTCGHLEDGEPKTVLSRANWLLMHFHTADSADSNIRKSMPGFNVEIQAVPAGKFNIKCYSVHPDVLNSLKKGTEEDALILAATDLSSIAVTGAITSGASASLATWTGFLAVITLYSTIIIRAVLH